MKVLVVARCKDGRYAPFITEQVEALKRLGVECRFFPVNKSGIWGYLLHLRGLKRAISAFRPDLIHAHYGLSGLFANLQRRVPVVTTYHGSDINDRKVRPLSRLSIHLSAFNIFVSRKILEIISPKEKSALIPCGINLDDYPEMEKSLARLQMHLSATGKYVLFAGAFDNAVKNAPLAEDAISRLESVKLIELKGYSRAEVAALMYAADALLMTSLTEGSPQVIKEALACGTPIVSVGVADVEKLTSGIDGCYITNYDAAEIAGKIRLALTFQGKTNGRSRIFECNLSNDYIAKQVAEVYELALKNNTK
jgi:glycosyltransferase involved in cell wall biosynthesis